MTDILDRYFIALVPPEPILSETQALKEHFKEVYNSKASLNSPPHITLHMPFRWKAKKEHLLIDKLTAFAASCEPITLELKNFKAFPPRVIYLGVVENETLTLLQKNLERFCKKEFQLFNANRLDQAYDPHLTLAFRDLKKEKFAEAWINFSKRSYHATFNCECVTLLKHDGVRWSAFTQHRFRNKL